MFCFVDHIFLCTRLCDDVYAVSTTKTSVAFRKGNSSWLNYRYHSVRVSTIHSSPGKVLQISFGQNHLDSKKYRCAIKYSPPTTLLQSQRSKKWRIKKGKQQPCFSYITLPFKKQTILRTI